MVVEDNKGLEMEYDPTQNIIYIINNGEKIGALDPTYLKYLLEYIDTLKKG